jgi:hypothetical protein
MTVGSSGKPTAAPLVSNNSGNYGNKREHQGLKNSNMDGQDELDED